MDNNYICIVKCPHCQEYIIIQELNCCIFRHGYFKDTNIQIPPHSTKEVCDNLVLKNLVYGCCKPFRVIFNNELKQYETIVCDYI